MGQPLFAELAAGMSAATRHVKDEHPAATEQQQQAARPQPATLRVAEVLARLSGDRALKNIYYVAFSDGSAAVLSCSPELQRTLCELCW
jgi:hypothetical protein